MVQSIQTQKTFVNAALENDLSTSFIEKLDLEKRLSSAERMIEKGKAYHKRLFNGPSSIALLR